MTGDRLMRAASAGAIAGRVRDARVIAPAEPVTADSERWVKSPLVLGLPLGLLSWAVLLAGGAALTRWLS